MIYQSKIKFCLYSLSTFENSPAVSLISRRMTTYYCHQMYMITLILILLAELLELTLVTVAEACADNSYASGTIIIIRI